MPGTEVLSGAAAGKRRQTWLFGAGADGLEHQAMTASGADVLIQDLEDFTPVTRRPEARGLAAALYERWRAVGAVVCVRINSLRTEGLVDLRAVMPARPDIVSYPKAQTAQEIRELDAAMGALEAELGIEPGRTQILPVCETALGVADVRLLAAASPRVRHALLGTEDLCTDLQAERGADGIELAYARQRFLLECRAAGIEPIDCPYTFNDAEGAAAEARHARRLGYRAKSLARADHVAAVRAAMTPGEAELEHARQVVAGFESARSRGEDRALVDGQWVEVPSYLNARRLLASFG